MYVPFQALANYNKLKYRDLAIFVLTVITITRLISSKLPLVHIHNNKLTSESTIKVGMNITIHRQWKKVLGGGYMYYSNW